MLGHRLTSQSERGERDADLVVAEPGRGVN